MAILRLISYLYPSSLYYADRTSTERATYPCSKHYNRYHTL